MRFARCRGSAPRSGSGRLTSRPVRGGACATSPPSRRCCAGSPRGRDPPRSCYNSAMANDESRSIFISGAASGIGRATALLFAERGWRVGGFDIDARALAALDKELAPAGGVTGPLDVTDPASFAAAIATFGRATGGRLDLFHNNAGIAHSGFFEDVPQQAARRIIDVNFAGVVNGAYAALPLLRATPNSLCFNTASSSAIFGVPNLAVYSATKFAVKGLTE